MFYLVWRFLRASTRVGVCLWGVSLAVSSSFLFCCFSASMRSAVVLPRTFSIMLYACLRLTDVELETSETVSQTEPCLPQFASHGYFATAMRIQLRQYTKNKTLRKTKCESHGKHIHFLSIHCTNPSRINFIFAKERFCSFQPLPSDARSWRQILTVASSAQNTVRCLKTMVDWKNRGLKKTDFSVSSYSTSKMCLLSQSSRCIYTYCSRIFNEFRLISKEEHHLTRYNSKVLRFTNLSPPKNVLTDCFWGREGNSMTETMLRGWTKSITNTIF